MCSVNILEAKTNFSKLIQKLETRQEDEIIVCRNGDEVVKITLIDKDVSKRIGSASGMFVCPDSIDDSNEEIAAMFGV